MLQQLDHVASCQMKAKVIQTNFRGAGATPSPLQLIDELGQYSAGLRLGGLPRLVVGWQVMCGSGAANPLSHGVYSSDVEHAAQAPRRRRGRSAHWEGNEMCGGMPAAGDRNKRD